MQVDKSKFIPDQTTMATFSLMGPEAGAFLVVDSKDGKIIRTRPYHYNTEYTDKHCNPWSMEARGKKYVPIQKVLITQFGLGYKSRVYSKNRILYPMKRVDWDPNGERHPETRGKSKYVRISWDEAAQLCADELKRMKKTYGCESVLVMSDMHGEGKNVAPSHGCPNRLAALMGGYTIQMRNMDSWEGWYWGAKHVWGCEPVGEQNPQANLIPDMAKHSDTLFFWGCDMEVTPKGFGMQMPSSICNWYTELGIKQVYVCPEFNYGASAHADKWIPVLPNTDAALQLAIAYVWLTEETYDKEYIATHTYGFDKFMDYVMGKEDGVPKTPKWASEKCGVSVWTIKALARHWAKHVCTICHGNGGSYIRGPYSSEPARLEVMLLGMQGLGKPGRHQTKMIEWNMWAKDFPVPFTPEKWRRVPHICDASRPVDSDLPSDYNLLRFALPEWQQKKDERVKNLFKQLACPKQFIPRCLVHRAILEKHAEWYGMHAFSTSQVPDANNYRKPTNYWQFEKKEYPRPGCSTVHMIWTDSPANVTNWNHGNLYLDAYRDPDIETIVAQHIWLEDDCYFADIILPVCTQYEMHDIGNDDSSGVYQAIYKVEPATPHVGESMSDFDVCAKVAEKLGPEYYDVYTGGGMTEEERVRLFYKVSGCEEDMSFEDWDREKVFVNPCKPNGIDAPAGFYNFWKDPEHNKLTTPTGLLEYSSKDIEKYMPDDPERPPVPHWIEKSESHDERLSSERSREYPLLLMSNHGRWRMHAQCDDIVWNREVETHKIRGKDGYQYEPCWLSPEEAKKRGIEHGDIVKVFNERGIVLCAAYITERLIDKTAYVDHGSRLDPIDPGRIDRGGAINSICPTSMISKNCTGMATSGYLVEVAKVTDEEMEEWKRQFPEAFERKLDPDICQCFDGWIEGGAQ